MVLIILCVLVFDGEEQHPIWPFQRLSQKGSTPTCIKAKTTLASACTIVNPTRITASIHATAPPTPRGGKLFSLVFFFLFFLLYCNSYATHHPQTVSIILPLSLASICHLLMRFLIANASSLFQGSFLNFQLCIILYLSAPTIARLPQRGEWSSQICLLVVFLLSPLHHIPLPQVFVMFSI